jgi:perosamine synthetase
VAVLRSGWLAEGPEVAAFEDEVCAFLGLPAGHAVALSSGSAALWLALQVLGAQGREVALPAYACASLTNACHWAGGVPCFIDNAPGTPNVDLTALRARAAGIALVPHYYGIPQDLAPLSGLRVVEDCAQALGARVNGVRAGLQGDVGVFSFYVTKLMTSGGQGGMLVSRNRALVDAARDFREFDQRNDRQPRMNLQMTDLQAAIGRAQLKKLPAFLTRREALYGLYREAGLPLLDSSGPGLKPVRFRAVLTVPEPDLVIRALEAAGVRAINPLEAAELQADPAGLPHAAALCARTVSLPLYPSLADSDARRIAAVVRRVLDIG